MSDIYVPANYSNHHRLPVYRHPRPRGTLPNTPIRLENGIPASLPAIPNWFQQWHASKVRHHPANRLHDRPDQPARYHHRHGRFAGANHRRRCGRHRRHRCASTSYRWRKRTGCWRKCRTWTCGCLCWLGRAVLIKGSAVDDGRWLTVFYFLFFIIFFSFGFSCCTAYLIF